MNSKEILQRNMSEFRLEVIAQHYLNGKVVSGRTIEGYETQVSDYTGTLLGWGYSPTMVTGRCPGKTPHDFWKTIYEWMQKKGLQATEKNARAIAYVITKKGTKQYREGKVLDVFETPINNLLLRLQENISSDLQLEITTNTVSL